MPRSILISGASSGIGKALSLALDRQGYQVFAGVRKPDDADALRLQASPQLTPVMLDITQAEMIRSACKEVSEKTGGELYCLVNNAGISNPGPLEFMPLEYFRQQLEVNLVGQLALTQACMPMLRKSLGRIIFTSSSEGRLATPFSGPYAASKAALIAMADSMRIELAPWRIPVSVLIVGSVRTPIWEKAAATGWEIKKQAPPESAELYGRWQKRAHSSYKKTGNTGMQADQAAKIILRYIARTNPKAYYLVGNDAILYELIVKLLPIRLRDWLMRREMGLLKQ